MYLPLDRRLSSLPNLKAQKAQKTQKTQQRNSMIPLSGKTRQLIMDHVGVAKAFRLGLYFLTGVGPIKLR
jgi:hypothetical protein